MKQRHQDQNLSRETKKEYIIRLAQEDPFLKIEDIAVKAETTQRYVRTILSEANLSLMHLREEYARKMEKFSESKIMFSVKDSLNKLRHDNEQSLKIFTYGPAQCAMIKDSDKFIWNNLKVNLYSYNQHIYYYEKLFGMIVCISPVRVEQDLMNQKISIFRLLGLTTEETRLSSPEIETGKLIDLMETTLNGCEFCPEETMIKINTFIHVKEKVMGKEIFYFPSEYVKLTIPGYFSSILELTPKEKA